MDQLDLDLRNPVLGDSLTLQAALRQVEALPPGRRQRMRTVLERQHDLLTSLPVEEDLTFCHSGLCQTSLPHRQPSNNSDLWTRKSGKFSLTIRPGVLDGAYVGVPYGTKARLIMFHLQQEGLKSRTVSLGRNLSEYLDSLGLEARGGPRGTIRPVQEQAVRIGRCQFTLQWDDEGRRSIITDTAVAAGMEMWKTSGEWQCEVTLSEQFHEHLRHHAVPLDKRGIRQVANNSLGLDLYALFAYRLRRLKKPIKLTWEQLGGQLGNDCEPKALARRVRDTLPLVQRAYPGANVHAEFSAGRGAKGGLVLRPSPPAVPDCVMIQVNRPLPKGRG